LTWEIRADILNKFKEKPFIHPGLGDMILRVSDIPDEGLQIQDRALLGSPFSDPSWRLERVDLRAERDGDDVIVVGEIDFTVPVACGRCLEEFPVRARAAVDVRLIPRPPTGNRVELGSDDLDLDFYDHDEVNLSSLVESETALALPMKPLCREDCRGLCPVCGGNRNLVTCACPEPAPDPRLAVLKDLAARLHHERP
jgi:uncharacterized protein